MSKLIREPTTPGEILQEEFLTPLELTQKKFADHIGCDLKTINRIVNGRQAITTEIAVKIAAALSTTPEFWLNMQRSMDLWEAHIKMKKLPKPIIKAG